MKLYNSLTRQKEEFEPINLDGKVGIYTCGPTVYDYVTIGNWRTYILGDIVVRSLKYLGHEIDYIMNITDVGHLTGDNEGDASIGEDRMEKARRREGKSAWDIAEYYSQDFLKGFKLFNLTKPNNFTKATDHIGEQIDLVKRIEGKGLTYATSDGIYFDVVKYESEGNKYGDLSNIDQVKEGARVKINPNKRDPRDFALWKFSYEGGRDFDESLDNKDSRRQMEWKSPWGLGFPGWHVECSAMSIKYLGEQFDIHLGGEDLRSTHHPNEVVQSETVTGKKPFVKYWMHGAFLQIDGGRMGKSLGNAYTLANIVEKGFDPLDLRYFYLTGHYRKKLNFTWEALTAAKTARSKLMDQVSAARNQTNRNALSDEKLQKVREFSDKFRESISDDFNMPQALAVLWSVVKSNIPSGDKYDLAMSFDEVLGLRLSQAEKSSDKVQISDGIEKLLVEREKLRDAGKYDEADDIRAEIEKRGYTVKDTSNGIKINENK